LVIRKRKLERIFKTKCRRAEKRNGTTRRSVTLEIHNGGEEEELQRRQGFQHSYVERPDGGLGCGESMPISACLTMAQKLILQKKV